MQAYPYQTEGEKARWELVKGGFKFSRNGSEFMEIQNRETKRNFILADLPDGKGGRKYDVMSVENWSVLAHNADALIGMAKAHAEGKKAREASKGADCIKLAATLKGANVSLVAIKLALKGEGYSDSDIQFALDSTVKA